MKKLLALLLCVICMLFAAASANGTVGTIVADGVEYTLVEWYDDVYAVVTNCTEELQGDILFVPQEIEGYRVESVHLRNLPENINTLCTPSITVTIFEGDPTFTWLVYGSYEQAIEWGFAPIDGATDDTLVLLSADKFEMNSLLGWSNVDTFDLASYVMPEKLGVMLAAGMPASSDGSEHTAEAIQTEGLVCDGFTYDLRDNDAIYDSCVITALPEGQEVIIIPETLNGLKVLDVELKTALPEAAKVVFYPNDVWIYSFTTSAEFIGIRYCDYDSAQDWSSRVPSNMTADNYVVVDVEAFRLNSDGDVRTSSDGVTYNVADLPAEINGKALLAGKVSNLVTSGEKFTFVPYNDGVKITGFNVAADQTVVVVPPQLDGKNVERIELEYLPAQVEVVYLPEEPYMTIKSGTAKFIQIEYVDYNFVQQNKDSFKSIAREMGENDVVLHSLYEYTYTDGSYNSNYSASYPASEILTEIEGLKAWNNLSYSKLSYEHESIRYTYYNDEHTAVQIVSMPYTNGEILFVPSSVNGLRVSGINLGFLGERENMTVVYPNSAWLDSTKSIDLIHAFSYVDRFYYESNGYTVYADSMYLFADTPTVGLTYYYRHEYGDSDSKATIEYFDVPTQAGNVVLRNKLRLEDLTLYTHEDYSYVKLNDSDIAIVKYSNEFATKVTVPSRLDGLTVTAIFGDVYDAAFDSNELTSIELPATLKVLGDRAIGCWNLKTITIPDGLVEIGDEAFYNMSYKANALKLPEGVTKLGVSWSRGFGSKLKTIKLPSTITEIPASCFYQTSFSELKLTDTIQSIGASAFEKMSYLKTLTLPNTLTVIPDRMVANSEKLAKITIPENVVSIGNDAFAGCTKLASVTYKSKGALTTIGDGAFASSGLKKFAPPAGVTTIGKNAALSCSELTTVELPQTATSIGAYAFSGCEKLTKVTLPEGLTVLPEGLFNGCKKLAAVTIPASVTEISEYVFEGCSSKLILTVTAGSYAEEWANANGISVKVKK